MSLSPNAITHFTDKLETIKSIMTTGFKIKYCREKIVLGENEIVIYVPMVSFCDIQLYKINEHIIKYGCYGIGMKKEWATRNKLNPVLYVNQSSFLSENLAQLISHLGNTSDDDSFFKNFDVFRFIKNYEGILERKEKSPQTYRFADEREWRYVPPIDWDGIPILRDKDKEDKSIDMYNQFAKQSIELPITPDDIKYIFIKNDGEIESIINHISSIFTDSTQAHKVETLKTRIITHEQILTDI